MHPKIILPRVSLSQLIFCALATCFCGPLFRRPRIKKNFSEAARMSISFGYHLSLFKTTKYHFPGAQDKVDLIGLLFSILFDDKFAAAPPQRATRSISSDFCSQFCLTNKFAAAPPQRATRLILLDFCSRFHVTYEFAAAPPQHAHTDNYHTNTTGGWLHQISQAWAVHTHAPTNVPPVVADHFFPIISWCHRRGRGLSNMRISTHPHQ